MDNTTLDLLSVLAIAVGNTMGYLVAFCTLIILAGLIAIFVLQKQLKSRKEHFYWIMKASELYLFEYDGQRDELWFSPKCAKLLEVPELVRAFSRVSEQTKDTTLRRGLACVRKVMACSKESARFEILKPDGRMGIFDASSKEFCSGKEKRPSCVGILTDVTREVREQEALDSAGGRDGVTGVFNAGTTRFLIERRMREQRPLLTGALILVDVAGTDRFSAGNGQAEADAALKSVAGKLLETIRGNDILGRVEGNRFAIYISNQLGYETLYGCCERFRKAAEGVLPKEARAAGVHVSIGGVMIHEADELSIVIKRAEQAVGAAAVQGDAACCVME